MKIQIILGSTREGRQGSLVSNWIYEGLKDSGNAEYELIDLADYPLPIHQEAGHPSMGQYKDPGIKKWAVKIAEADGFIIVTPEYNHGYPAVLKLALDSVYNEWNKKPVVIVGYSAGAGAGIRAVEQLRQVAVHLEMVVLPTVVAIPEVQNQFDETGKYKDPKGQGRLADLEKDLLWYADILKPARDKKRGVVI